MKGMCDWRLPRSDVAARGFSLVELMVSLVVASLGLAGVMQFFENYQRVTRQQEQVATLQTNLRAASDRLTTHLRRTDYGAPRSLLPTWIDWVSGFDANPKIVQGASATIPDRISIAACTTRPVAMLNATLPKGVASTTMTVTSLVPGQTVAELLDPARNRDLIRFVAGAQTESGFARVVSVSGASITIDTDPGTVGEQGFGSRDYFVGTPICRVDVTTYTVDTASRTLTIDEHQGSGVRRAFDNVTNLQIGGGGNTYTFVMSAQSDLPGNPVPRQLAGQVTVRND